MKYICKNCGEAFLYEPVFCNDCGIRFSYVTFRIVSDKEKSFTEKEVDYILNDVLNKVLILNRQSDLFTRPTSNKIALFVINYLKNPLTKLDEEKIIALDIMNLGMTLRQDQLDGYDSRSGREVLDEFLSQL